MTRFTDVEVYAIIQTFPDHDMRVTLMDALDEYLDPNTMDYTMDDYCLGDVFDRVCKFSDRLENEELRRILDTHIESNSEHGHFKLNRYEMQHTPTCVRVCLDEDAGLSNLFVDTSSPLLELSRIEDTLIMDSTLMDRSRRRELRNVGRFRHEEIALWNWEYFRIISVVIYRFVKSRNGKWAFSSENAYGNVDHVIEFGTCTKCLNAGPVGRMCPLCQMRFRVIYIHAEPQVSSKNPVKVAINSFFVCGLYDTKIYRWEELDELETGMGVLLRYGHPRRFEGVMSEIISLEDEMELRDFEIGLTVSFADVFEGDRVGDFTVEQAICWRIVDTTWKMSDLRNEEWVRFHRFVSEMDEYFYSEYPEPSDQWLVVQGRTR